MIRWLHIILVLLFFTTSCEKSSVGDCFKSTGSITKIERPITGFHTIVLKDNIDLVLKSSDENRLFIEAGNNLLSEINTEVKDSVLTIENKNRCNWVRSYDSPLKAYLNLTKLDTIEYRSIGDISSIDTIFTDNLVINVREGAGEINFTVRTEMIFCNLHYGTADIKMRGMSKFCSIYSASFGLIDNRRLLSDQVYLNSKSSNDTYVFAKDILEVTIENIGNVYYMGNPNHVMLSQSGTGELIKLTD